MASIDRIVTVNVTKTSATISQQGFGTGLGVHQVPVAVQSGRFQTYSNINELVLAGFDTTSSAYLWATAVFSQQPSPTKLAIGRRGEGVKKRIDITITAPEVGTWLLDITDVSTTQYAYIASGADTNETIAAGLKAQIDQDVNAIVVTDPVGAITVDNFTAVAGLSGVDFSATLTPPGAGTGTAITSTPNTNPEDITVTLTAIDLENSTDWYLFTIDSRSDADITAAAAYAGARSQTRFYIAQTSDPDMPTNTAPNIGTVLGGLSYDNVQLRWCPADLVQKDGAMLGVAAAFDLDAENGAGTWANKELKGIPVSDLQTSEIDNIVANNGDVYVQIAGRGNTLEGKAVSGEFCDIQTTIAWVTARVQEAVFVAIATQPTKLPYTNAGINIASAAFLGVLQTGVFNGHFSGDDETLPRVEAPAASDVSLADKSNRILRNLNGFAKFSGAIHTATINLSLSF